MLTALSLVLACAVGGAAATVLIVHGLLKLFAPEAFKNIRFKQKIATVGALSPPIANLEFEESLVGNLQVNWAAAAQITAIQYQHKQRALAGILSPVGQAKPRPGGGLYPGATTSVN